MKLTAFFVSALLFVGSLPICEAIAQTSSQQAPRRVTLLVYWHKTLGESGSVAHVFITHATFVGLKSCDHAKNVLARFQNQKDDWGGSTHVYGVAFEEDGADVCPNVN